MASMASGARRRSASACAAYLRSTGSTSPIILPATCSRLLVFISKAPPLKKIAAFRIRILPDGRAGVIVRNADFVLASNTAAMTEIIYPGGNAAAAAAARASNQYQFQLEHASLVSAPVPTEDELERLTRLVAQNNFYSAENGTDRAAMNFLRRRIKHVIYVVKENRTFDQILGDLGNGSNGNPSLTQFGQKITPNHHQLARQFVTLDNFMDPGDGSMDGWSWTLQGRVTK